MSIKPSTVDSGRELVRPELLAAPAASNLAFNEKIKGLQASGEQVYHFGFGQSPFPVPDCLVKALQDNAHRAEYLNIGGLPSLRQAIASLHHREDGLSLDPDAIVVGPGSKELLYLTMAVATGVVIIPGPAWTTYAPQVQLAGGLRTVVAETVVGAEGGGRITPALLEEALDSCRGENVFLILTNPGNPTGTCFSKEELKNLSKVCRKHKVVVLSDEIYARLTFDGNHNSMVEHYPEGTILFSGKSKYASIGGWRLGYAHYPPQLSTLRGAVTAAASQTYSCASAPVQYAVAQTLTDHYDELLNYSRDCTRILKALGEYCFQELTAAGLTGTRPMAGYYFMPDFAPLREELAARGITTGPQLMDVLLKEAKVALMSSSHFLMPEDDLSTRFCFVCFDGGKALQAMRNMEKTKQQEQPTSDRSSTASKQSSKRKTRQTAPPAKRIRQEDVLSRQFLTQYCGPVVKGVAALKEWVLRHKN